MNNITLSGVSGTLPSAPTTSAYKAPESSFNSQDLNQNNIGYSQTEQANSDAFSYNPSTSGGLSFSQNNVDTNGTNLNLDGTKANFDSSQSYISDDALVEKRLTDLLSEDNPYIKLQQTKAAQAANQKGLSNTSMAVTAGQTAAINAGLDIAKSDAATYAQADLARQSSDYQSGLSQQTALQQGALAQQQTDLTGRLADQTKAYEWDTRVQQGAISGDLNQQEANTAAEQARMQGLTQGALAEQQGNITAESRTQEAYYQQESAKLESNLQAALDTFQITNANSQKVYDTVSNFTLQKMNLEAERISTQAQLNEAQRESFAGYLSSMQRDYEVSIQNILLDVNLNATSKNKAIQDLTYIFNQDLAEIGNVFGVPTVANSTGTAGIGVTSVVA